MAKVFIPLVIYPWVNDGSQSAPLCIHTFLEGLVELQTKQFVVLRQEFFWIMFKDKDDRRLDYLGIVHSIHSGEDLVPRMRRITLLKKTVARVASLRRPRTSKDTEKERDVNGMKRHAATCIVRPSSFISRMSSCLAVLESAPRRKYNQSQGPACD